MIKYYFRIAISLSFLLFFNSISSQRSIEGTVLVMGDDDLSQYNDCDSIFGRLMISDIDIKELTDDVFPILTYVKEGISISGSDSLLEINGFNNLDHVEEGIFISYNYRLKSINGFNSLKNTDNFHFFSNGKLEEIDGFNEISVVNSLIIDDSPHLKSIGGFLNLENIDDGFYKTYIQVPDSSFLESFPRLKQKEDNLFVVPYIPITDKNIIELIGNNDVDVIISLYEEKFCNCFEEELSNRGERSLEEIRKSCTKAISPIFGNHLGHTMSYGYQREINNVYRLGEFQGFCEFFEYTKFTSMVNDRLPKHFQRMIDVTFNNSLEQSSLVDCMTTSIIDTLWNSYEGRFDVENKSIHPYYNMSEMKYCFINCVNLNKQQILSTPNIELHNKQIEYQPLLEIFVHEKYLEKLDTTKTNCIVEFINLREEPLSYFSEYSNKKMKRIERFIDNKCKVE